MKFPDADWQTEQGTPEEADAIARAVAECERTGIMATIDTARGNVYARPATGRIVWGVNGGVHGICIAQGCKRL